VSTLAGGMLETRLQHVRTYARSPSTRREPTPAQPTPSIDTGVPADRRRRLSGMATPLSFVLVGISLAIGAVGWRLPHKRELASPSAMEAVRASAASSDAALVAAPLATSPPVPPPEADRHVGRGRRGSGAEDDRAGHGATPRVIAADAWTAQKPCESRRSDGCTMRRRGDPA
jgi:hypothetical protein